MSVQEKQDDWGTNDVPPTPLGLTPAEYILVKNATTDASLRAQMVNDLTHLFRRLNIALFFGIAVIVLLDAGLLWADLIDPTDRIISPQVVMTLIGATAAQLGVGFFTMVAYLFPKRNRVLSDSTANTVDQIQAGAPVT
jgi:hypothetical protein